MGAVSFSPVYLCLLAYVLREKPLQQLYLKLFWESSTTRRNEDTTVKITLISAAWLQVTIFFSSVHSPAD